MASEHTIDEDRTIGISEEVLSPGAIDLRPTSILAHMGINTYRTTYVVMSG